MAQKTIQGSKKIAAQIRSRRNELGLTIEEAAAKAGVGTKTWCRYEAGESIRKDKCKGVCKALGWNVFPEQDEEAHNDVFGHADTKHEAWSSFLADTFGDNAAKSFAVGSDILLDRIKSDMEELASMPRGTHLGQLSVSWLCGDLPEQFLMHYDYDFLYQMKCTLLELRRRAKYGISMTAHSVMEELVIYLCNQEAMILIEISNENNGIADSEDDYSEEWVFDLFDDMDIVTFLYSGMYLDSDHSYHFANWSVPQFWVEETTAE